MTKKKQNLSQALETQANNINIFSTEMKYKLLFFFRVVPQILSSGK